VDHRQAFLDALSANPGDDALWLVFADWLDDHGEAARAEAIRAGCELDRLPPADDRAQELGRRAEDLEIECERQWLGEWADRLVRWRLRRGFLHHVTLGSEVFLRHGGDLLREHPVRRFHFVDGEGEPIPPEAVPDVVASPHLAGVRSLDLAGGKQRSDFSHPRPSPSGPAWANALAAASHAARLEELVFPNAPGSGDGRRLSAGDLRRLAAAEHLRSLRVLDLGDEYENPDLNAEAVAVLASASFAGRLRHLGLAYCPLGDEGVARLAGDRSFALLRSLDLEACTVTDRSVRAVLESPHLAGLESVVMDFEADLRALAASPRLAGFRSLGIRGSVDEGRDSRRLSAGWQALAGSPYLRPKHLALDFVDIGPRATAALLRSPGLAGLESLRWDAVPGLEPGKGQRLPNAWRLTALSLNGARLDGGPERLARWPGWPGLRALELIDCRGASRALAALLAAPGFGRDLRSLALVWGEWDDADVIRLAGSAALARLRFLRLDWQNVSDEAIVALAASPHLQQLEKLHLVGGATDRVAVKPLHDPKNLPRLRDVAVNRSHTVTASAHLRRRLGPRLRLFDP
jgi:uncharacterized protein (TIGR02996 family)